MGYQFERKKLDEHGLYFQDLLMEPTYAATEVMDTATVASLIPVHTTGT